jgi:hypothetical protein
MVKKLRRCKMIVLAVFFAIFTIVASLLKTTNTEEVYFRTLGLIAGLVLFTIVIARVFIDRGYKQGQIDALTNNIQYKLITLPDSTKCWKRIGDVK